ncbi:hypothetical protein EDB84DRAFT_1517820, partial [Lactarius hengduanensis]
MVGSTTPMITGLSSSISSIGADLLYAMFLLTMRDPCQGAVTCGFTIPRLSHKHVRTRVESLRPPASMPNKGGWPCMWS